MRMSSSNIVHESDVVISGCRGAYRTNRKASKEAAIKPAHTVLDDEEPDPFGPVIGACFYQFK
jgi:hypothetical protein